MTEQTPDADLASWREERQLPDTPATQQAYRAVVKADSVLPDGSTRTIRATFDASAQRKLNIGGGRSMTRQTPGTEEYAFLTPQDAAGTMTPAESLSVLADLLIMVRDAAVHRAEHDHAERSLRALRATQLCDAECTALIDAAFSSDDYKAWAA